MTYLLNKHIHSHAILKWTGFRLVYLFIRQVFIFRFSPPPAAREINIDMIEKMLKDKVRTA